MASTEKKIMEGKKNLVVSGLRLCFIKVLLWNPQTWNLPGSKREKWPTCEAIYALARYILEFQQKTEYLGIVFPWDFFLGLLVPIRVDF